MEEDEAPVGYLGVGASVASVNDDIEGEDGKPYAKGKKGSKARTIKPLPEELMGLTDANHNKDMYTIAGERDAMQKSDTYGEELRAVQSVKLTQVDGKVIVFDLKKLNADQIRQLSRNVGCSNTGSANKFRCRVVMATYFDHKASLIERGINHQSSEARTTSTLLRIINVIFSDEFVEEFKQANDRKSRVHFETKTTNKGFYIRACLAYNAAAENDELSFSDGEGDDPDYSVLVVPEGDEHISDLRNQPGIDLARVEPYDTENFRRKIMDFFAIRKIMKTNMTTSGTHESDPWNFIQQAIKASKCTGVTHVGMYYFFMRCENTPGIDESFQPFLNPENKGSTEYLGDDSEYMISTPRGASGQKRQLNDMVGDTTTQLSSILKGQEERHAAQLEEAKVTRADTMAIHAAQLEEAKGTRADTMAIHAAQEARAIKQEERAAKQDDRVTKEGERATKMARWESELKVAQMLGDTAAIKALGEEAKSFDK
jgi:hypothetical protein